MRFWAELLRSLNARFLAEMKRGDRKQPPSLYFGEILGSMAGMITQCEAMARRIDALPRTDAYAAFQRALAE